MERYESRALLAQVVLTPIDDNTIFQESPTFSNGAGVYLYSGQAGQVGFAARRALLKFDVAASIPAGSTIDSVSLRLSVSRTGPAGNHNFSLHRLLADWGEGTADADGAGDLLPGGKGVAASNNDATWARRFHGQSASAWTTQGGDFAAQASATTLVAGIGTFPTWTPTAQVNNFLMLGDVQRWVDTPSSQFGWLLRQDPEGTEFAAKRFDSKESATPSLRPTLTINYTPGAVNTPPTLDAINGVAINEDAGQQTVNLAGITAGGTETQSLAVSATTSNPALIQNLAINYTTPATIGTLTFSPVANQFGAANVTVTVRDAGNDGTLNTGDDGTFSRTFTVTVNAVNDPPTLDAVANRTPILEDASQQTVNLTGISAGPNETQNVSITAISSNTGLIPDPLVTYTSGSATGSLRYTPVANQSGSAVITVTVRDAGIDSIPNNGDDATISQTFSVTVDPVNDPPTINSLTNPPAIQEDALQQTFNLSGITAGPIESQGIAIGATSNNTALIPDPQVNYTSPNSTGSLTYTPVTNQTGSAIITVSVRDAGLDNILGNGDDITILRSFNVVVQPVNDLPTLDSIANPAAINEDAGQQTVNVSGITAGPSESQTLAVTATSSNPGLIPNPTVSYTSPGATGSLTYTPVADQFGAATITVTVRDAGLDNQLNTGDDGTFSRTFTIAVNPINDPPTLDPISNPAAIQQDAGQQTINLTGISAGPGEVQVPSIATTSSNPSLIPNPAVSYSSPSATGSLSYTPVAGQNGSAIITVTVRDTGQDNVPNNGDDLTVVRTFTVLVNSPLAVNQPPTFTKGPDRAATDTAGLVTVPGWATNISPGPPEESAQTVIFIVLADNPSLFSGQPVIEEDGTLRFAPARNAHGTTVVTVRALDNGGTENGGDDMSEPQTFSITIDKPLRWHNSLHGLDVTGDGSVVAGDALAIINRINGFGSGVVPASAPFGPPYFDTTGDNSVAANDVLAIINYINAFGSGTPGPAGEGEASISPALADAVFLEFGNVVKPRRRTT